MRIKNKFPYKVLLFLFIVTFVISSVVLISNRSYAKPNPYIIKSATVVDIKGTTEGSIQRINNDKIENDFVFHELNDSVTLKVVFKNTDNKEYIIKSLLNDKNDYIKYNIEYNQDELVSANDTFEVLLTLTYKNEIKDLEDRISDIPINISVVCIDDIPKEEITTTKTTKKTTKKTTATTTTTTTASQGRVVTTTKGITTLPPNNRSDKEQVLGVEVLNNYIPILDHIKDNRNIYIILLLISLFGIATCSIILSRDNKKSLIITVLIIFVLSVFTPLIVNAEEYTFIGISMNRPKIMNKVIVKYDDKKKVIDYNSTVDIDTPNKEGYTFLGWLYNDELIDLSNPITKDIELTSSYKPNNYTIIYDKNNNKAIGNMDNQEFTYDKKEKLNKNNYSLSGYMFDGWTINSDGSGKLYKDSEEVKNILTEGITTLYAKWHKITYSSLKNGSTINAYMKKIAGNNNADTSTIDKNIKAIKYTKEIPNQYKDDNYVISDNTYDTKTYMWYKDGIIYYFSDADYIYLHSSSANLFQGLNDVKSIDVHFDTSKVTDMSQMFFKDVSLEELDLTKFNTSKVTTMRSMFSEVNSMKSFDFSSFDTSKVKNFAFMFNQCYAITELDLSHFNTSSATDLNHMFSSATGLKELRLTSFNTTNLTNMEKMFHNMDSIELIDLSSFDTSKVTNMNKAFENEPNIKTIIVSDKFTTTKVKANTSMFSGDTNLIGGNGTTYDSKKITVEYAHIDEENNPGYFTRK